MTIFCKTIISPDYFGKIRFYAKQYYYAGLLLSAKQGLFEPDVDPIDPYEETHNGARIAERRKRAEEVDDEGLLSIETTLIIHTGKDYYGGTATTHQRYRSEYRDPHWGTVYREEEGVVQESNMTMLEDLWQGWANRYVNTQSPTPLFETDENLVVEYKHYGSNDRPILKRSEAMEQLLREEGRKVINDWETTDETFDGLIYLMYWLEEGDIVPLYFGKAGKYGRGGEGLSANLRGLRGSSTGKFARWGDGHYYHIGNLSAIVFDHDKNQKQKYKRWADRLFTEGRRLRQQTYFWTKAWRKDDAGPFHHSDTTVEEIEGQLIELTSDLYPDLLLNTSRA